MTSNASWYWSSDYKRDQILRDELSSQAAASSAATARLRSQLAKVQGSLDQRLTALTRAFDAYVELGDVREQLNQVPSSAQSRLHARAAMSALRAGEPASPVPDDGSGHWLIAAMNQVIAVVDGDGADGHGADDDEAAAAEVPALPAGPDAAVFVAAALASLGRGEEVADLVPPLLITDGGFTGEQAVLFAAAVRGRFGPAALAATREVLAPSVATTVIPAPPLDQPSGRSAGASLASWPEWLTKQCGGSSSRVLAWVLDRTTPVLPAPAVGDDATAGATPIEVAGYDPSGGPQVPKEDLDARLTTLVDQMIEEGSPQERDLLQRATELRARIENPGAAPASTRWEVPLVPVAKVLRSQFEELPAADPASRELLRWVLPLVRPAIDAAVADVPAISAAPLRAQAGGGIVEVTVDGAVPASRERAVARINDIHARLPLQRGHLVTSGVLAVIGVVLVVVSMTTIVSIGWLGILLLAIAAGVTGAALWRHRLGDRPALVERDLAALESAIDKARTKARGVQDAQEQAKQEHAQLVTQAIAQLAAFEESERDGRMEG